MGADRNPDTARNKTALLTLSGMVSLIVLLPSRRAQITVVLGLAKLEFDTFSLNRA